jgi:hypothetical protein
MLAAGATSFILALCLGIVPIPERPNVTIPAGATATIRHHETKQGASIRIEAGGVVFEARRVRLLMNGGHIDLDSSPHGCLFKSADVAISFKEETFTGRK